MENFFTKTLKVEYSDVDKHLALSLFSATNFIQNIMTDFFNNIGITNTFLKRTYNAAWVISKLKIHFIKYPLMNDILDCHAYISHNTGVRLYLESTYSNKNNDILFLAKQEICSMDLSDRKARKLQSIGYTSNLELHESIFKDSFSKLNIDTSDFDNLTKYTVSLSDIDFTNHVNNASYIRFMINTFTSVFFEDNIITDLDIRYINECHEGDLLNIFRKQTDNIISFVIKQNDKVIAIANMLTCCRR